MSDTRPIRPAWTPPPMIPLDLKDDRPVTVYIVTFPECWRTESHPVPLPRARRCHPDGFVIIRSRGDYFDVVSIARTLFLSNMSTVEQYGKDTTTLRRFPLGCLATYDASARRWIGDQL